MKKCRCIIAGSRNFDNYEALETITLRILGEYGNKIGITLDDIEIIEGGAIGADRRAGEFANKLRLEHTCFPANWEHHGRSAGHVRNADMANYAVNAEYPVLIAFWDGLSKGTSSMISTGLRKKLKVFVVDTNTFSVKQLN